MERDYCASSSQGNDEAKSKNEVKQLRMPVMLLKAAINGNRADLIELLELEEEEKEDSRYHSEVTIDPPNPARTHIEASKKIVVHDKQLQSVTQFGDTVLHILVTNKHNELACMVYQKDRSLLKARNKMLETPLHSAVRVGNNEVLIKLIELAPSEVKDVLREKNCDGETALHVATKHGHGDVAVELMQLNTELAYEVDDKGLSPLYIATDGGYTRLVKAMLQNDASSAYIPDSNGLCPVHVAARMGNAELVMHFMQEYPDSAKLMDRLGRNLFQIAAEENKKEVFIEVFALQKNNIHVSEMVANMIDAKDCEGNTPFHIAAMKGHYSVMKAIWLEMHRDEVETVRNNKGPIEGVIHHLKLHLFGDKIMRCKEVVRNNKDLTPFDLSAIQVKDIDTNMHSDITDYVKSNGRYFTERWFLDMMTPLQNKLERSQIIGLGSVLITTATFAVAFTLPGGLNQDNGTPILGRNYMFQAFIMANTLAFVQAFISLFTLVWGALHDPDKMELAFAMLMFRSAANCLVYAFGYGSYVMLAPVSMPIAITVLVLPILFGSLASLTLAVPSLYKRPMSSYIGLPIFAIAVYYSPVLLTIFLPFM